ncbi:MAG: DUF389 domain-containing protein [Leptolyngbyaceae cyanobacterium SM2_3_12]|nr:DUF389 domain-containing protein [Leptolyngbyaceae cyanobacterium SM2_3_12]
MTITTRTTCSTFWQRFCVRVGGGLGLFTFYLRRTLLPVNRQIPAETLNLTRQGLLDESQIALPYMVLVIGSCLIATFGLLANSAAVIIGAMLIAPLMLPIRGAAFGILDANKSLMRKSLTALAVGTLLAVAISSGLGRLTGIASYGSEVMARSQPNLLDLGVAVTAGGLAGFAAVEPKLSSSVAGVAIAVALMPPICVVGLWLAQAEWNFALGALLLYCTNLFGITLACMVAFVVMGYAPWQRAQRPIGITLLFTALLVLPLGASTIQLLRQNQLEASLKTALLDRTLTFQRLSLVDMTVNWVETPPQVYLTVRAAEPVSPKQVQLLEEFVDQAMGRPFELHFFVSQLDHVTRDGSSLEEVWQGGDLPQRQGWQGN